MSQILKLKAILTEELAPYKDSQVGFWWLQTRGTQVCESPKCRSVCPPEERTPDAMSLGYLVGISEDIRYPIHKDEIPQEETIQRAEGGPFPMNP